VIPFRHSGRPAELGKFLSLRAMKPPSSTEANGMRWWFRFFRPPSRELPLFFLALSTLLESGMSLPRSLECCHSLVKADYPELARAIDGIFRKVAEGANFATAFTAYGTVFSPLHCNLIKAGDQSGRLPRVLRSMAEQEEQWYVTRQKIYQALTYPALMALVLAALMLFVLPATVVGLVPALASHGPLPWPTQLLFQACQAMRSPPFWLGLLFCLGVAGRMLGNSTLREKLLQRLHSSPVLGRTLHAAGCHGFFYALHLQTEAGLNLHASLRSAADVSGHRPILESITRQNRRFREGEITLPEVFVDFEPVVVQSISTLHETGKGDQIFASLSRFYKFQLEDTIERALNLLNPLMTLLMGLVIGFVVVATALPIVRLADTF
jgi:type IV pilus assembly protein PilC